MLLRYRLACTLLFLGTLALATFSHAQTPEDAEAETSKPAATAAGPDASVEEILVTGTSVTGAIDQARFSESILDVLSAEDFSVTGDSSVVDALSRVTGVTTVGDKYVYVRGLGERYSNTLFNSASLPSPDPVRRVVPLDLFPAGVMEQLSVQKTYAPYLPADFAGGSLQLTTRSIPAEREARMTLSADYNTQTTLTTQDWYQGSNSDWTGWDGGYRDLPVGSGELLDATPERRREIGLDFRRSFDTEKRLIAPDGKLAASYANNYDTRVGPLGFIMGIQIEDEWEHRRENRANATGNPDSPTADESVQHRTTNAIQYSGLGSVDWAPRQNQEITATLFYTHLTEKRYIEEDAHLTQNDVFVRNLISEWEEQALVTAQLEGVHNFSYLRDLGADWGLTYSRATRQKPDARQYTFDRDVTTGELFFSDDVSSNTRTWEDLTDTAWDSRLGLEMPFRFTDALASTLKVGGKYFHKQRESELLRFRYIGFHDPAEYTSLPISDIFADENITPGKWELYSNTLASDSYDAEESIGAAFLQIDTELGEDWRLMVGARYESSTQTIITTALDPPVSELEEAGFYPAAELTWLFRQDMQLRAAWSRTVNRPDLREISPVPYLDPENRYFYFGNPDLKVAQLSNYDLRWEWYHDGSDNLQLAFFYKELTDPIEEITLPAGNRHTWENSKEASLWGFEVAVRQSLLPLGRWLEDFYVRANASYINSEVTSRPESNATNAQRPLQGQSDWITNFQLTYDSLSRGLQATAVFNMYGERITDVGVRSATAPPGTGRGDAKEQPSASLDVILKYAWRIFDQDIDLTFKAKNLVDPKHEIIRSGVTEREYRTGRTFTIELSKDF